MKSEPVPVPAYYGALNKIAEGLGAMGEDATAKQETARKQLLLFSVLQIVTYLDANYSREESKHQKTFQRIYIGMVLIAIGMLVGWLFYDPLYKISPKLPNLISAIPTLWLVVAGFLNSGSDFSWVRLHGMAILLSEYAEVEQVPQLVEALQIKECHVVVKDRLTSMLPRYHQADRPPLSQRQIGVLTRCLKTCIANILHGKDKTPVEADIAFVAATLIFFERELAHGNLIPKAVLPLLRRFAAAPASSIVPPAQWTMLQSAAEECLASVGAHR